MALHHLGALRQGLRLTRWAVQGPVLARARALPAGRAAATWHHSSPAGAREWQDQRPAKQQKDQRAPWLCPACKQPHWSLTKLTTHIDKCCPDLCREQVRAHFASRNFPDMLHVCCSLRQRQHQARAQVLVARRLPCPVTRHASYSLHIPLPSAGQG